MKHEFLSRGKRLDNGEWIEGFYVHLRDGKGNESHRIYTGYAETDCGEFYPDWFEVVLATVGQYTGLTDKNGVRIFEGDIIKANSLDGDYLFVVTFGGCGGVQNVLHDVGYIGFYLSPVSTIAKECSIFGLRTNILYWANEDVGISVVANIHDNPELLKGGAV